MRYIVEKKQLEDSSYHMYTLYGDKNTIIGSTIEETVMSVFREFCNAKAAGTLHSVNELTVCQYICPKGRFKITKRYSYLGKVRYVIWEKKLFWWFDIYAFAKCDPHDEDMPAILKNYVDEGIPSTTLPAIIAEC